VCGRAEKQASTASAQGLKAFCSTTSTRLASRPNRVIGDATSRLASVFRVLRASRCSGCGTKRGAPPRLLCKRFKGTSSPSDWFSLRHQWREPPGDARHRLEAGKDGLDGDAKMMADELGGTVGLFVGRQREGGILDELREVRAAGCRSLSADWDKATDGPRLAQALCSPQYGRGEGEQGFKHVRWRL
jgi:hypothetical protein